MRAIPLYDQEQNGFDPKYDRVHNNNNKSHYFQSYAIFKSFRCITELVAYKFFFLCASHNILGFCDEFSK